MKSNREIGRIVGRSPKRFVRMATQKQRHLDRMRRISNSLSLGAAIGIIGSVTANNQGWAMGYSAIMTISILANLVLSQR